MPKTSSDRAYAQRFIVSAVRLGLSGAGTLRALRANNISYGNDAFNHDYNAISSSLAYRRGLTSSDLNSVLPSKGFIELSSISKRSYVYPFQINILDDNGITIDSKVFSFSGKSVIPQSLAFELFKSNHPQRKVRYKLDYSSVQFLDPISYIPIT